jgi:hypothetical protein
VAIIKVSFKCTLDSLGKPTLGKPTSRYKAIRSILAQASHEYSLVRHHRTNLPGLKYDKQDLICVFV